MLRKRTAGTILYKKYIFLISFPFPLWCDRCAFIRTYIFVIFGGALEYLEVLENEEIWKVIFNDQNGAFNNYWSNDNPTWRISTPEEVSGDAIITNWLPKNDICRPLSLEMQQINVTKKGITSNLIQNLFEKQV